MEVKKISEDNFTFFGEENNYKVDFGTQKKGTPTKIKLLLSSELGVKNISIKASCGCTTPTVKQIDNNSIEIEISYNSGLLGVINKKITHIVKEGAQQKTIITNINGLITI